MKIRGTRIAVLLGGVAALALGVTFAQGANRHGDMHSGMQMDQHVLSRMHEVNQMEMQMGQMAEKRGQSARVRDYGRRLRKDHAANDRKVTSLAHREGIRLVSTTPMTSEERNQTEADQRAHHDLMSARGTGFDRTFMQAMQEGHGNVARMLTRARGDVQNGRVRALLDETIPTVQRHRRMAEDTLSRL